VLVFVPKRRHARRKRPGLRVALALGTALFLALPIASPTSIATAAETISYDQILAQPDDAGLNLEYARQQVAVGNLQQASAALERLLLVKPNWDSVRLFYGVVLYRLDDLAGAKRELALLEGRDLSPTQERERRKYLQLATQASKKVRMSARFSLGARTDSNPGRLNEDIDFFGLEDGSDSAVTGIGQFRVEADLSNGRGEFVFFQVGGVFNQYFEIDQADYVHAPAKAGITFHGVGRVITPFVFASASTVQDEDFRREFGGGLDTTWSLTPNVDWFLNGRARYQNYDETSFSFVGDRRDGWLYEGETGFRWRPSDRQTFTVSGYWGRKEADADGFSYDKGKIEFSSLTLLGGGFFLNARASYTRTDYDEIDFFSSFSEVREDDRIYGRLALGAPLGAIFSGADLELPDAISDIVAQIGVSYTDQESSISKYDFENWSADLLFTKRIAF